MGQQTRPLAVWVESEWRIFHHVSYDKETNTMEMQLTHKESYKAVSHKGGVKDRKDQTGQKYKRNSYAK